MSSENILPPGHHPLDQPNGSDPPAAYHAKRLLSHLRWSLEWIASFEKPLRADHAGSPEAIHYVGDYLRLATARSTRLAELLDTGYGVRPVECTKSERRGATRAVAFNSTAVALKSASDRFSRLIEYWSNDRDRALTELTTISEIVRQACHRVIELSDSPH